LDLKKVFHCAVSFIRDEENHKAYIEEQKDEERERKVIEKFSREVYEANKKLAELDDK